jgi:hypothetical protein
LGLLKKYIRLLKNFDISPAGRGNLSKFFIYTFWGINAIIFLGSSISLEHNFYKTCKHCNGVNVCPITKKLDVKKADVKFYELIRTVNFIIISSNDFEIPEYDVSITPTGRAPPSEYLT